MTVVMSSATCAVLAAVFPLLLLAIALEGRAIHRNIVRLPFFRWLSLIGLVAGLLGTATSVVGVQLEGLETGWAFINWLFFGGIFVCIGVFLIAAMATNELAADREAAEKENVPRLDLLADLIRGRRS